MKAPAGRVSDNQIRTATRNLQVERRDELIPDHRLLDFRIGTNTKPVERRITGMTSDEGSPRAPQSHNDWSSPFESVEQRNEFLKGAYREHRSAIYELASRVCGADRAAEVTQEVFLRFWNHPEQFDPLRGALSTYLRASTHDVAIDFLRREIASYKSDAPDVDRALNQSDSAIVSELRAFEAAARVTEALASLAPGERDAILGAFYGRASYRAVAAASGLPVEVITSRIRRGLLRMEKALRSSGSTIVV